MASLFRRPPEIIWVGIAVGLAIWGIVSGDPLTLIACGSFLATQFLAMPVVRLPLWVVFAAVCAIGAVLAAGDGEVIDLIIWALLVFLALYEISSDFTVWREAT